MVLIATPCTQSLGGGTGGHKHGGGEGRKICWSSPQFLAREQAAVDVDVGPERRSPRYRIDDDLMMIWERPDKNDDVHYYIGERLKLERETENMCV